MDSHIDVHAYGQLVGNLCAGHALPEDVLRALAKLCMVNMPRGSTALTKAWMRGFELGTSAPLCASGTIETWTADSEHTQAIMHTSMCLLFISAALGKDALPRIHTLEPEALRAVLDGFDLAMGVVGAIAQVLHIQGMDASMRAMAEDVAMIIPKEGRQGGRAVMGDRSWTAGVLFMMQLLHALNLGIGTVYFSTLRLASGLVPYFAKDGSCPEPPTQSMKVPFALVAALVSRGSTSSAKAQEGASPSLRKLTPKQLKAVQQAADPIGGGILRNLSAPKWRQQVLLPMSASAEAAPVPLYSEPAAQAAVQSDLPAAAERPQQAE